MQIGDEVMVIEPGKPYHKNWGEVTRIIDDDRVVIQYEYFRYEIQTLNILGSKQDMYDACNCDQSLDYKKIILEMAKDLCDVVQIDQEHPSGSSYVEDVVKKTMETVKKIEEGS